MLVRVCVELFFKLLIRSLWYFLFNEIPHKKLLVRYALLFKFNLENFHSLQSFELLRDFCR